MTRKGYTGPRRRHRRFSNRDRNHQEIVDAFLSVSWNVVDLSAVGNGVPDLIVGGMLRGGPEAGKRVNLFVEVKTDDGGLRENQEEFIETWQGRPVEVVRNRDEVFRLIGLVS